MTRDEAIEKGAKLNQRNLPTITQFRAQFRDEESCRQHFFNIRWPDGVVTCPRCKTSDRVKKISQPWRWQCRNCDKNGYRFSLTSGTVFENTKYPLKQWFEVMYWMLQSKKGMSALQIHRQLGSGDYRTAWYMCHRIRSAFYSDEIMQLAGEVEIDETFVGGKEGNKHRSKRHNKAKQGKIEVLGAIERKGNVVCKIVNRAGQNVYNEFVREAVSDNVSLIASDESNNYAGLKAIGYPHKL